MTQIREAARQRARYEYEVAAANRKLQAREQWVFAGRFLYGLAALVAAFFVWSWVPVDLPAWIRVLVWVGVLVTWAALMKPNVVVAFIRRRLTRS